MFHLTQATKQARLIAYYKSPSSVLWASNHQSRHKTINIHCSRLTHPSGDYGCRECWVSVTWRRDCELLRTLRPEEEEKKDAALKGMWSLAISGYISHERHWLKSIWLWEQTQGKQNEAQIVRKIEKHCQVNASSSAIEIKLALWDEEEKKRKTEKVLLDL